MVCSCLLAHLAKGHLWFCHHSVSVIDWLSLLTFHILIIFSQTTGSIGTQLCRNYVYEVLYNTSPFCVNQCLILIGCSTPKNIFIRPSRDGPYYVIGYGGRLHRFPHNNFSSVYRIFTKLGHMNPLLKGKNPIYFGVIRSKVKVTVSINRIFNNRVVSAR